MNVIQRTLHRINLLQQRHKFLAFPYAVVKKYGDDEAAYEAAIITYYGFLSLFPLLLTLTTVLQIFLKGDPALRNQVSASVASYFPVLGDQLQQSIHTTGKTGIALVIGILLTLYGARGGADAFRHGLNHVWHVPYTKRTGFPGSVLKSLSIIAVGGLGLIASASASGYATAHGHYFAVRFAFIALSFFVLYGLFIFLFKIGSSVKRSFHDVAIGAVVAAAGLMLLQSIGGYLITHQLNSLHSIYGTFAIVLGLLFWIYLQAQMLLYAMEIDTVRAHDLWPRSLEADKPTQQDRHAYMLYAKSERYEQDEAVKVKFDQ